MLVVLSTICLIIGGLLLCAKHNVGKNKCDMLSAYSASRSASDCSNMPYSSTPPTASSTTNNSQFEYSGITDPTLKKDTTILRSDIDENNNQKHSSVRKLFSDEDTPTKPTDFAQKVEFTQKTTQHHEEENILQPPNAAMPDVNFIEDPDDEEATDDTMFDVASIKTDPPTPLVSAYAHDDCDSTNHMNNLDETLH